jgi:mannosyl-oligosaccharide alpha-1,2-mannosidase
VNLFETSIRVLGGLLSTYHLSGDQIFLDKAKDLGDRLLPAFSSKSGIPYSDVNIGNHRAHGPSWGSDSSTAETTTVQLEFKDLTHTTGDTKYATPADRVNEIVAKLPKTQGLVPIFINANSGYYIHLPPPPPEKQTWLCPVCVVLYILILCAFHLPTN